MQKPKQVLTTGQVAKVCHVAPRTVSKWFDNGQLRGYRIPGSRDRRIPLSQLIRFMKAHGIPLDGLDTGRERILIVDNEADLTRLLQKTLSEEHGYEVQVADSAFQAGALTEQFRPHILLVDVDLPGIGGRSISRHLSINAELQDAQLIAMSASLTEADRQSLLQQGFHHTIAKPFTIQELTALIEETLAAVS